MLNTVTLPGSIKTSASPRGLPEHELNLWSYVEEAEDILEVVFKMGVSRKSLKLLGKLFRNIK